jgi:hypothetical protein
VIRTIDKFGRIAISMRWFKQLSGTTVIVAVEKGKIVIQPYDPSKHDLNILLNRRVDENARLKISPDIIRAAGLSTKGPFNLFVFPDNTAWLRKAGNYCDACGKEASTLVYKRRNLCKECFEKMKGN